MKKKLSLFSYLLFVALVCSTVLSSCKGKDDPMVPEITSDETAYYIVGEVLSDGKALEGVTVKADSEEASTDSDGVFELKLTKKGDYAVSFSKAGYVAISSDVVISSDANNKSSVIIRQVLAKKNDPVRVVPDENAEIGDESAGVSMFIPAGAVKEAVDISMTPFTPGQKKLSDGAVSANLLSLNMEPDGLVFDKPVEVFLSNPIAGGIAFGNLKHTVEENGVLKELDEVFYDDEKGAYKAILTGFSNHSFTISANASNGGAGTESLATTVIDNLGNVASVTEVVTTTQKFGWTISGDIAASIKSQYPSLPDATISSLASSVTSAVSSMMGSSPGVGEMSLTIPFNVSGDVKQSIEFSAKIENQTFSFPIILADGGLDFVSVSTSKYVGSEVNITYEYGSSHTDHSGGSGQ